MSTTDVQLDVTAHLRQRLSGRREEYAQADPFPHVVIDGVLPVGVFERAADAFPPLDDPGWNGYLHVNEAKYANPDANSWPAVLVAIRDALCGGDFVSMLSELTGIDELMPDPSMDGGGLHQTLRGGHLNIHTDFTTHHRVRTWHRRVNVLIYLTKGWQRNWGGDLELWDRTMTRCVSSVAPMGNRMLVFTTSGESHHGHPEPLRCPPDVARRTLALYYFTQDAHPRRRATTYRPRPGERSKVFGMWADQQALNLYERIRARFGVSDRLASRGLRALRRRPKNGP